MQEVAKTIHGCLKSVGEVLISEFVFQTKNSMVKNIRGAGPTNDNALTPGQVRR